MPALTDPSTIRALLETDRPWAVYALGDLCREHFQHCAWFHAPGPTPALALLYRGFRPAVLFALGRPDALEPLIEEITGEPELYLHVRPDLLSVLETRYQILDRKAMWRMLLDQARADLTDTTGAIRLGPANLDALRALYADGAATGESPDFFAPSMLQEGVYFGVWEGSELVAAAGTHLVVPQENVSAIGNVYARRDRRGRGLASRVTAAVAADLLDRDLRTVALNVNQGNQPAIRVYERLGFVCYCEFTEGLAVRRPDVAGP
jgi:ribosomal protein S18 acetylase RimI-like enzyme